MKKYIYIAVFTGAIFQSCSSDKKTTAPHETPVSVTLHKSGITDDIAWATASGKLIAKNSVNVSTRIMGYINTMHAEVGQNVHAGQLLVRINSSDIQAKSGQANAQISQARANYTLAKKDYERFANLYKSQSASQKELDDMLARYEMAKAGLDAANQMKNEVAAQYRYTNIAAPISGTITAKYAEQGDLANPGMPLLTIESPSALQVQVLISEPNITRITNGMPVQVTLKSLNKTLSGIVSEISKSSSGTGGQYLVTVNISSSSDLLPGMFASVQFPIKNSGKINLDFQESVMVPNAALVTNGQLTGVYVVSSQNTAALRWVKTGKTIGNQTEILSGLQSGEPYILTSAGRLYNGAKVQIRN